MQYLLFQGYEATQIVGNSTKCQSGLYPTTLLVMKLRPPFSSDINLHQIIFNFLPVLSMYKGQLNLIRKLIKDAMVNTSAHVLTITGQSMADVRMATTDNFQGEESDLVSAHPNRDP